MLVSYKWLNNYVDLTNVSPEALADKITKAGIEVEHIHYLNHGIKGVVVGYVESCEKHPEADKLNICQVNLGDETVQIICGAPNVAQGQKVPVAQIGAVLPGNFKIKKAKLRGEYSNGMICSLQELGVEGKLIPKEIADGICVLDEDAQIGEDAIAYLNLDDAVLDLDILPNSAHCLNMIGVAYEVAAILNQKIILPVPTFEESNDEARHHISVDVEATSDVPYYGVRMIQGVKVGPSPQWLQNYLIAAGIRPISNIVDITNYVMLEYGQPLHAFDYDKFGSEKVLVRYAKNGETMVTLDDQERTLQENDVLITNGEVPVAIAGVMGGANSEVSQQTTNILLEAAMFDALAVRRTSSRLQLRTDASTRYEKGIDRNRVTEAADRACELMVALAGGTVLKGFVEQGNQRVEPKKLHMPWKQINDVLGTDLSTTDMTSLLNRLGFKAVIEGEKLSLGIPTRRPDVSIPEDIIEEVGRTYGYDHVPTTLPEGETTLGKLSNFQEKRRKIRRYLEGVGLFQAVTYSLTTPEKAEQFLPESEKAAYHPIHLAMPMSEDRSTLRMTILPQLLDTVQYHLNRQMKDVFLYEIGSVFLSEEEKVKKLPIENEKCAAVFTGVFDQHSWKNEQIKTDFYVVKGVLEGLFELLGLQDVISYHSAQHYEELHPGRTAEIFLEDKKIGFIGELHPAFENALDLNETYVFEIDLEACIQHEVEPTTYQSLPRFPAITRDIALVVDDAVTGQALLDVIYSSGGELLKEAHLFDVYQGEHLEAGKKSMAYTIKYYDPNRTLTEKEVVKVHEHVLENLKEQLGAVLRG